MIISHKHRFIFIKTSKTAGTSIEIALSGHCGADDVITKVAPEDQAIREKNGGWGRKTTLSPLQNTGQGTGCGCF